jgi:hypothetical protein
MVAASPLSGSAKSPTNRNASGSPSVDAMPRVAPPARTPTSGEQDAREERRLAAPRPLDDVEAHAVQDERPVRRLHAAVFARRIVTTAR